jgi:phosphoribosylanthranilate isomerase
MGVDAIGVVAVPGSPRFLPVAQRLPVFQAARGALPGCLGVLVVADPTDADLASLMAEQGHQVVQLHGGESVERCRDLRRALGPGVGLWKALRIRSKEDLQRGEEYGGVADALLLDAWAPGQLGGTGCPIPLEWLEALSPPLPWWLAGGISPETVGEVLACVRPHGLDASSAVEDRPGWKNLERVQQLRQLVHSAKPPETRPLA